MSDSIDGKNFVAYHADTIDVAKAMPDDSVDFSIYSPPFSSLFVYSASPRDLGNVKSMDQFLQHYDFLLKETFRVMRPGRLVSVHCMELPTSKVNHGYIGLQDFPGDIIRGFQRVGFIYHSSVTIQKDPVIAMQRTKALGLLHKQIKKDSCMSRMGIPDRVVTFRKPGENTKRVEHTNESYPVGRWQKIANPIWDDIDPQDTLQYRSAREHEDERHICPLQLEVIRRCMELWSRPDDLVWSPFMGIGSEGVVALEMQRKFVGAELKESYFKQAVANLHAASSHKQADLFSLAKQPEATNG